MCVIRVSFTMFWFDGDIHFPFFLLRCWFCVGSPPLHLCNSNNGEKNTRCKKKARNTLIDEAIFFFVNNVVQRNVYRCHTSHNLDAMPLCIRKSFLRFIVNHEFAVASFAHFLSIKFLFVWGEWQSFNICSVSLFFCIEPFHDPDNRCHISDTCTHTHTESALFKSETNTHRVMI